MATYHGRRGVVYISTTGTTTATNVIKLTQWTLNMPTEKAETTGFGDANKTYVQGLKDITGALAGWWDNTEEKLFQAADSTDGIKMYLYPSSDASGKYWYGPAWLDASIDTNMGGAISVSANFAANGAWGRV